MVKYEHSSLDGLFGALADPTRRGILERLSSGSAAVSELAQPFAMSLPGFTKHLRILEEAGLLRRRKSGRVVHCTLAAAPMQSAAAWLARYEAFWSERLEALAEFLDRQEEVEPCLPQSNRHRSRSSATSRAHPRKSGRRGPRLRR